MSDTDRQFVRFQRQLEVSAPTGGPQLERALYRIGMISEARIKARISRIGLVDQGALINSIRYNVSMESDGGTVTVSSDGVKYAAIHEFGGEITPKNARALTIPAAPWAKYRRARDFKLIRIKNILVDPNRLTPGSKTIPRDAIGFRLVKRVTIRPKWYFRDGIRDAAPTIVEILRGIGA